MTGRPRPRRGIEVQRTGLLEGPATSRLDYAAPLPDRGFLANLPTLAAAAGVAFGAAPWFASGPPPLASLEEGAAPGVPPEAGRSDGRCPRGESAIIQNATAAK